MNIITVLQLIAAVAVITLILLQQRSSGAGGLFGGGDGGGFYQQRRGMERTLFIATIVAVAILTILSVLNFIK